MNDDTKKKTVAEARQLALDLYRAERRRPAGRQTVPALRNTRHSPGGT
jgi:hypothetical protein